MIVEEVRAKHASCHEVCIIYTNFWLLSRKTVTGCYCELKATRPIADLPDVLLETYFHPRRGNLVKRISAAQDRADIVFCPNSPVRVSLVAAY